jgi:LuxR family transcriptional regulator, maltose regulon positive regulatory protein
MTTICPSMVRLKTDHSVTLAGPAIPALPVGWTRRAGLNQRLEAVEHHRLTLVTGPPGAGKTTLLAGWTKDRPDRTTAWLELEAIDNEPSQFWRRAVAAL